MLKSPSESFQDKHSVAMYPEMAVTEKPRSGHSASQIWVISKVGHYKQNNKANSNE